MYDKKTHSKWVHANGVAMKGPLKGKRLEILPSRTMRWTDWKELHPNTQVLAREGRSGFMGSFDANNERVMGISVGRGPRATLYPFETLIEQEVINDRVTGEPIVVTMESSSRNHAVFSRQVDGQVLTFRSLGEIDGKPMMKDQETGSTWSRIMGKAVDGPLEGAKLNSRIAVPWRIDRWMDIYNKGTVYSRN